MCPKYKDEYEFGQLLLLPAVFLRDAVGHVGSDGAHLGRSLHVKHLVIEVDVRSDLLQHGALGRPRQEQGLVDLQAPCAERLEGPDPGAGRAAGRDKVRSDRAVEPVPFGVELLLELPEGLQEALQGTLVENGGWSARLEYRTVYLHCSIKETFAHTEKPHTWSSNVSSFSLSCSKNLSRPCALKMRSDSSEKRTASPSKATLSWASDTSVIFPGMNMVAAAMPEGGRVETLRQTNWDQNSWSAAVFHQGAVQVGSRSLLISTWWKHL